jgi:hypothetical protein
MHVRNITHLEKLQGFVATELAVYEAKQRVDILGCRHGGCGTVVMW